MGRKEPHFQNCGGQSFLKIEKHFTGIKLISFLSSLLFHELAGGKGAEVLGRQTEVLEGGEPDSTPHPIHRIVWVFL